MECSVAVAAMAAVTGCFDSRVPFLPFVTGPLFLFGRML